MSMEMPYCPLSTIFAADRAVVPRTGPTRYEAVRRAGNGCGTAVSYGTRCPQRLTLRKSYAGRTVLTFPLGVRMPVRSPQQRWPPHPNHPAPSGSFPATPLRCARAAPEKSKYFGG
jgi:hypothetical protein